MTEINFDFPLEIRKIIYTTNTIENLNRNIRKYTKTKVQFTDDLAAQKAVYMAIMNIEKKWRMPIQNCLFRRVSSGTPYYL